MAEHMTVCGGHLEAGATKKQVFRYFEYFLFHLEPNTDMIHISYELFLENQNSDSV